MTNSTRNGIIGVVIGVLITVIAFLVYDKFHVKPPKPVTKTTQTTTVEPKSASTTQNADTPVPYAEKQPVSKTPALQQKHQVTERTSVKPQAIDRVFPKLMKGVFQMKGRGTDAKWGMGTVAYFEYSLFVIAESKILSKKALPDGTIKVEEIRKFEQVRDGIAVSKLDFVLALDTLPLENFSKTIDVLATIWATITGDPIGGRTVKMGKDFVLQQLKRIDEISVRKVMREFGVELPSEIEKELTKIISNRMLRGLGGLRSISGKSYLFQYYQEKDGTPLMITFKNEDGSEVTNEEEQMILKRVNAFIDYHVMPNTESRPGDSWTINAVDIQEVFDPFVDGRYTGNITVERRADTKDNDWFVEMKPGSSITVISDNGTTNGTLRLHKGRAVINPDKYTVKEVFVEGDAGLKRLSKHHFLFTARIDGRCNFQGRVVTFPIKDTTK